MIGSFSPFRTITAEELELFKRNFKPRTGVYVEPLCVASQVVNGIKYAFLCEVTPIVPAAVPLKNVIIPIVKKSDSTEEIGDEKEFVWS